MPRGYEEIPDAGPTIAAHRARLAADTVWSALGGVRNFAAIAGAGFEPAGQVFGSTVMHLGNVTSRARCTGTWTTTLRTDLATEHGPYNALLRRLSGARRLALSRAVEDCRAVGGHGVVGARLSIAPFPAGGIEVSVQGTAVRARAGDGPAEPFTAHVSGQEFSSLLSNGWMPFSVVFGISIASRHDDMHTRQQLRRAFGSSGNREVTSYSSLVNDARRDARKQLQAAVAARGGEGVVVNALTLRIDERECPNEGQDHVAEATILGSALLSFARPQGDPRRSPLTIMHLEPRTRPAESTVPTVDIAHEAAAKTGIADRVTTRLAAINRERDVFNSTQLD